MFKIVETWGAIRRSAVAAIRVGFSDRRRKTALINLRETTSENLRAILSALRLCPMTQIGPNIFVVFLYYFLGCMVISAIVGAQALHESPFSGQSVQAAVPIGFVLAIVATYFNRTVEYAVSASNPKALRKTLESALRERGYELDNEFKADEDFQSYRRSGWQQWTTGRIFVKWQGKSVTLVGRSSLIVPLQQELSAMAQ